MFLDALTYGQTVEPSGRQSRNHRRTKGRDTDDADVRGFSRIKPKIILLFDPR
jgi:hypothetical protein